MWRVEQQVDVTIDFGLFMYELIILIKDIDTHYDFEYNEMYKIESIYYRFHLITETFQYDNLPIFVSSHRYSRIRI